MNKQFIITNFAAFALMLFLPTGCRQADGKQDAVQSYRVIKVAASPVEISESYSAAIRGRRCLKRMPSFFVMPPVYYPFLFLKHLWSSQLSLFGK